MVISVKNAMMRSNSRNDTRGWVGLLLLALTGGGCADDSPLTGPPGNLRFGQVGRIEVRLMTPTTFGSGDGQVEQTILWESFGGWEFIERISYQGGEGDVSMTESPEISETLGDGYASLIVAVNESPAARFVNEELGPVMDCEIIAQSLLRFIIFDDIRDETREWQVCVDGSLPEMRLAGSTGPNEIPARVVSAAQLTRDRTVGASVEEAYRNSAPFSTLDRGDDSGFPMTESFAFLDGVSTGLEPAEPTLWEDFWRQHKADENAETPVIDWERDIVIVGSVGIRNELGDSIEVRKVIPGIRSTLLQVHERVPGDFCSPVARLHTPFHIVVTPRNQLPLIVADVEVERFSCGIS